MPNNKTHFFFPYNGNKRNEVNQIIEYFERNTNIDTIDTIIEPFCGTSALSCFLAKKYPKKFKYILNDNDKQLIELYELLKDKKKTYDFMKRCSDMLIDITKEKYKEIIKSESLEGFFIKHKYYSIVPGLYPSTRKLNTNYHETLINCGIIDFVQNEDITFSNLDGVDIYKKYSGDISTCIFLDPPYLCMDNTTYRSPSTYIYEYLYINKIEKSNAYIILCINYLWIFDMLFGDQVRTKYNKTYEMKGRKKVDHVIISNRFIENDNAQVLDNRI